jgi:hypothetical protein
MWLDHHPDPTISHDGDREKVIRCDHHDVSRTRSVRSTKDGWVIEDLVNSLEPAEVSVNWAFAPEVRVEQTDDLTFKLTCSEAVLWLRVDSAWNSVKLVHSSQVSPSFRVLTFGSAIKLVGESNGSRPYVTVLERQR